MLLFTALLPALAAPPGIDDPLRTGASAPADAAVVIGLEGYPFLPDVPYAGADARAFRDLLVYTRGVPPERVRLLDSGNREQILGAVDQANDLVGAGGTLWVYFAGHGATAPDSGALLLVGDDAKRDADVFLSRSVSTAELEARVTVPAHLVLDTCHAGAGRGGEELLPGTRFAVPAFFSRAPASTTTTWTAATPGQISGAYAPAEHGLFTYFAVGALRGWADGELDGKRDGAVTAAEAQAYVERALARVTDRRQIPQFHGPNPHAALISGRHLERGPELGDLPTSNGTTPASAPPPPPARRARDVPPEGCPWAGESPVVASASMSRVTVNGRTYDVTGPRARAHFVQVLGACGAGSAVPAFDNWRAARRTVNATGPIAAVVWPLAFVTGGFASAAGVTRENMVRAISNSTPPSR